MHSLFPLMIVPLIVWLAVWAYTAALGGKVKRLEEQVRGQSHSGDDE